MQGDQVQIFRFHSQEIGRRPSDERIAEAVKPILAQLVALCNCGVNRVCPYVWRERGVKLAVKASDIFGTRKIPDTCLYNTEAVGVMERSEIVEVFQVVICVLRDELGGAVITAMNNSVADHAYVVLAGYLRKIGVLDKRLEEGTEGVSLADCLHAQLSPSFDLLTVPRVAERRWGCCQATYLGFGKLDRSPTQLGTVDRDFHRRRTGIDGEYYFPHPGPNLVTNRQ